MHEGWGQNPQAFKAATPDPPLVFMALGVGFFMVQNNAHDHNPNPPSISQIELEFNLNFNPSLH
jgi:hypothetical protein